MFEGLSKEDISEEETLELCKQIISKSDESIFSSNDKDEGEEAMILKTKCQEIIDVITSSTTEEEEEEIKQSIEIQEEKSQVTNEIFSLKEQISTIKSSTPSESELSSYRDEIQKLTDSLNNAKVTKESTEQEISELQANISHIKEELESTKEEEQSNKSTKDSLLSDIEHLKQDLVIHFIIRRSV